MNEFQPKGDYTLAELCICAAAEAWRENGEVLATGIGVIPRLAASLAKMTFAPELMMTDGEAYLVSEPVPLGPLGDYQPKIEGKMSYRMVFENLWGGKRHAMIGPVQIDQFGQTNISVIGDYQKPKVQLLGVRGLPGNSINHPNSAFVQAHTKRAFVDRVDMVSGAGYNPARWPKGATQTFLDLRLVVSNLAVLDFNGPNHSMRIKSLHPGISVQTVQDQTTFRLYCQDNTPETPDPTEGQLKIIREFLDPHNIRETVFKS